LKINRDWDTFSSFQASSAPSINVAMVAFASVFLDYEKKREKNLVSISFQLVKLWLGWDWSQALAFQVRKNGNNLKNNVSSSFSVIIIKPHNS